MKSIRKGTNDLVFLKEGSAEITGDQEIAQHMKAYLHQYSHMNKTLFRKSIMFLMKVMQCIMYTWRSGKTSEKPKHTQVPRS